MWLRVRGSKRRKAGVGMFLNGSSRRLFDGRTSKLWLGLCHSATTPCLVKPWKSSTLMQERTLKQLLFTAYCNSPSTIAQLTPSGDIHTLLREIIAGRMSTLCDLPVCPTALCEVRARELVSQMATCRRLAPKYLNLAI